MSVSKRVLYCLAPLSLSLITFAFLAMQGCGSKTETDATAGRGSGGGRGGRGRGDSGPVPVVVATVMQKDVPVNIDVIGNVEAYSTISVKAQVGGQLTKVYFQEGDYVKKDDQLFTIDPRPFQAQLSQAQAQLGQAQANSARDNAALSQAQANLARDTANQKYAETEAGRYTKLFDQGIVSREQTDQMRANSDALNQTILADKAAIESARAQIGADKAAIANAEAMVENAKVQMEYTAIRSPIDGRTGNLAVKQGNIVTPNTMELMTIAEVHPIYVTFSVPEAQLGEIKKYMAQRKLAVQAQSQDAGSNGETGVLTFIDNSVDASTGTIKLKGTFENKDNTLWPGEFVRVSLRLTTRPNAVVVPNQAVQTGQDGQFVYVVKQDRTVEMRPVVTSTRVDQDLVVDSGLTPGETIVTEGQLRLAPNSRVQFSGRGGRGDGGRSERDRTS
ncbi:MAG TPA: efflux RND transporter periplasmic adaptor subunit [Bryobacteraceae bacterium]|nr:efflux RND transporter periplasmic adaptor subunit [Bryobacteraceae bacterium]